MATLAGHPPKLDEANKYRAARVAMGKLTTAKQKTKMKTSTPTQSQNTHRLHARWWTCSSRSAFR